MGRDELSVNVPALGAGPWYGSAYTIHLAGDGDYVKIEIARDVNAIAGETPRVISISANRATLTLALLAVLGEIDEGTDHIALVFRSVRGNKSE